MSSIIGPTSPSEPSKLVKFRSRADRGSHSFNALQAIFKASPLAHSAFMHDGRGLEGPDGDERPRIMNLPLLTVLMEYQSNDAEGEDENEDGPQPGEVVVYLHTYYGSRLVQVVKGGLDSITITTSRIDGLVLGSTPKGHSVNYRSAIIYGHSPTLLPNTPRGLQEKLRALAAVVNDVVGYDRTSHLGLSSVKDAKETAVVRVRIEDASCKQRTGGSDGDVPPIENEEENTLVGGPSAQEFTGVVPCWTQFGEARGVGKHREGINEIMKQSSKRGKEYALEVALARTRIEGR